ncbi:DUF3300 domain-containing protein, partial [Klebsiella pneumoniae]|nr:DUF3300 domain-containing protein [Klebsiella pneumoniae]
HVQQPVIAPHVQQPMTVHSAPLQTHSLQTAAPVHQSAVRPQVQAAPHVVQPAVHEPAATLHSAVVRPATVPQQRIMPHAAPAPQLHQTSVQPMPHRQEPVSTKPQEHRPIVEQHKVG